jgi:hypothetical protein
MKKPFIYSIIIIAYSSPVLCQPSRDIFRSWADKIRTADSYATGIEILVEDSIGNIVGHHEGVVKKSGKNIFYKMGDMESILDDSLYISINHKMKLVQCVPGKHMLDQKGMVMSVTMIDETLEQMAQHSIIGRTGEGWSIMLEGEIGGNRNIEYIIGNDLALRKTSYIQNDVRITIVYHGFTYQVDRDDEDLRSDRVFDGRGNLSEEYKDYRLFNGLNN